MTASVNICSSPLLNGSCLQYKPFVINLVPTYKCMDKRVDCVFCSHRTVHQWENVAIDNATIRDVATGKHNLFWNV